MEPAKKAIVIGLGNLAWSLIPNLQAKGMEVIQLISRSESTVRAYCEAYQIVDGHTEIADLRKDADIVFITVGDAAIAEVVDQLANVGVSDTVVVHTSGSTAIDVLRKPGLRVGVFYPMQTFTRDSVPDYAEIPVFLEGNKVVLSLLRPVAERLSNRVYELDSEARMRVHIGAVLACNFTNYLFRMAAAQLPEGEGFDFTIYEPLVREHIEKVFRFQPENTQTGPAVRGDQVTIDKHLHALADQPSLKELYESLSLAINPDVNPA